MASAIDMLRSKVEGKSRDALLSEFSIDQLADIDHTLRDAKCAEDPLFWLQHCTMTENPFWEKQGLPFRAPFPDKSYFNVLFDRFRKHRLLFIPKTRDMLTSWSAVGWSTHQAQFNKALAIFQTLNESKAQQLIEYASCLLRNQESFISERHPIAGQNLNEIRFADGARILAVPSGEHQIRMYKPTIYVMDEAAFLPEAEQCYNATFASSPHCQIIAISSAGPGWFADQCSVV